MILTQISILLLSGLSIAFSEPTSDLNYRVHIFYYPWYQAPNVSKHYRHWDQNKHKPPQDVGSNFYPVLGAYDSCDKAVIAQHMAWIASSGVGTVLTSWWGQGSFEDSCVVDIMDAAHKHKLKVGFHIESYGKRTAELTASDINYINKKYGTHPAYYRDPAHGNRPAFYIYSSVKIHDWEPIKPLLKDNILLGSTYNKPDGHVNNSKVYPYFSGFYPYGIGVDPRFMSVEKWTAMHEFCKSKGLIWSPSVGPGYTDLRAVANSKSDIWDRKNGSIYDLAWNNMFAAGIPEWVSITSFNEWHEGSIIEPASHSPPAGIDYLTYNGAYNKTGKAS